MYFHVNDLIVDYVIYKAQNGYEPIITESEFACLYNRFYEYLCEDLDLSDTLNIFENFMRDKRKKDWNYEGGYIKVNKYILPVDHMDMMYDEDINEVCLKSNYFFNMYDYSCLKMYKFSKEERKKINMMYESFLKNTDKRSIKKGKDCSLKSINLGKYLSSLIVTKMWEYMVDEQIKLKEWPENCTDINEYLFKHDLAKDLKIGMNLEEYKYLYEELTKRIAYLYEQDNNLLIATTQDFYLANSNLMFITRGLEKYFYPLFDPNGLKIYIKCKEVVFDCNSNIIVKPSCVFNNLKKFLEPKKIYKKGR